MSRVVGQATGIAWDAVPGAERYQIYVDQSDDPNFLAEIDAGNLTPYREQVETEWRWDPSEVPALDNADIAVVAYANIEGYDTYSDPYSPESWQDIPLAVTPVAAPTNGRLLTD